MAGDFPVRVKDCLVSSSKLRNIVPTISVTGMLSRGVAPRRGIRALVALIGGTGKESGVAMGVVGVGRWLG